MSEEDDGLKTQIILAVVIGGGLALYGLRLYLGRPLLPSWRSLGGPPAGTVLEEGERRGAAPLAAPARVEINGVPAQSSIHVVADGEPEYQQERHATPQGDMRVPGTPQSAANPRLAPKIFERPDIPDDALALQREKRQEAERENPILFFIRHNTQAVIAVLGMLFILGWIVWAKVTAHRPELDTPKAK